MNTLSDWVRDRFARAELFEKLGIDFCCGGHRTLKDACEEKKLSVKETLQKLEKWDRVSIEKDCQSLSIQELCEHVITTHHAYLRRVLPLISAHLEKIVRSHGEKYLELYQVFQTFIIEINEHMEKEEKIVFPLFCSNDSKGKIACIKLELEHDEAGHLLEKMRALTNDFLLPDHACMTLQTTWEELKELEKDMHIHVFKENHILFPLIKKQGIS